MFSDRPVCGHEGSDVSGTANTARPQVWLAALQSPIDHSDCDQTRPVDQS
jgi:hypothetical protein